MIKHEVKGADRGCERLLVRSLQVHHESRHEDSCDPDCPWAVLSVALCVMSEQCHLRLGEQHDTARERIRLDGDLQVDQNMSAIHVERCRWYAPRIR